MKWIKTWQATKHGKPIYFVKGMINAQHKLYRSMVSKE